MILVAGSANLDFVVQAHHIPQPGETVLGRGFQTFPGGKGANQAVACAKAGGADVRFLAALGSDAFAQPIEASLKAAQVELERVRVDHEATGTAFICVADDAQNAITVAPGANLCLRPEHLPALDGVSHLLLQLETPLVTVTGFAQAARKKGVTVVLNAAPAQSLDSALLACVDVLIVNEGELAQLAPQQGTIAQRVQCLAVPTIVVTLGRHGCVAFAQGKWHFQIAFDITPVDTTAAGDTFCGTLVAAISCGETLASALRVASAAAALACTRAGAQTSIPTAHEVNAFLAGQGAQPDSAVQQLRAHCGLS